MTDLKKTALFDLHQKLGAKLVPFAGWAMPVSYPEGIIKEHQACRQGAALFDVSHMGQITVHGPDSTSTLESLIACNLQGLKEGKSRYATLTNAQGGIEDDLIISRTDSGFYAVLNASRFEHDMDILQAGSLTGIEHLADHALLALQGPKAAGIIGEMLPEATELGFMQSAVFELSGVRMRFSRLGYTGEDGFEISLPAANAQYLAERLLAFEDVAPAGLGARDTLRLEAGLCLYGQDLDDGISPIEAGIAWTIQKSALERGAFPGAEIIRKQKQDGASRKLVGLKPEGRAPARSSVTIHSKGGAEDGFGDPIGSITSGGFGPSVGGPIAMGYVQTGFSNAGIEVVLNVRGKPVPAEVCSLPFVPHRYATAKNV